jgi:hypothetical protein
VSELIQLDNLPVETLAEMANEAAAACEESGRKTVEHAATSGRALLAIRQQIPHGQWESWVEVNFKHGMRRAQQFMDIAKAHRGALLEDATSLRHALRLIAESPEKQAKRAEREAKKLETPPTSLAPATPTPPVSVGTIRNENPPAPAPPTRLERPAWLADPDEMGMPDVDAMPQLPKTNTHHTSANQRTPDARDTDRVALVCPDDPRELQDGRLYVWSESANRLFLATPEELWAAAMELRPDEIRGPAVVEPAVTTTPVVEHKTDSVSSKPGKVPTAQQLTTAVGDRVHDGDWQDLWRGKLEKAVEAWGRYKQSLTGKAKVRSMESWEAALTRIETVAHDRGVDAVCDMIQKAIANGWQGWEHETNGSRGGSRISTAVRSNRNWDEEIPEWKPTE